MKLVRPIKICLNETYEYSRDRVGKPLSAMFPIKNGLKQENALSPLFFNSALDNAIRRVLVNQYGLKLNGTHPHLVNADDVNILGGRAHTLKKNTVAPVVASKEIGVEANDDKTKYMVMFRDQNAGQSKNIKIYNSSFGRVEEFKYLNKLNESIFCSGRY
jgi:hypothetical protein